VAVVVHPIGVGIPAVASAAVAQSDTQAVVPDIQVAASDIPVVADTRATKAAPHTQLAQPEVKSLVGQTLAVSPSLVGADTRTRGPSAVAADVVNVTAQSGRRRATPRQ
jgi:hypothetical protein